MFFGKSNSHGGFFKKAAGWAPYFLKHGVEILESPRVQTALSALSPTLASLVNVAKVSGGLERLKHY